MHLRVFLISSLLLFVSCASKRTAVWLKDNPCEAETQRICMHLTNADGPAEWLRCIKTEASKLPTHCKAFAPLVQERTIASQNACSDDAVKFCSAHRGGTPGLNGCLEENKEKLTEACRELLPSNWK